MKKIDHIIMLMIGFIVLLGMLFFYLLTIDQDAKNYNTYQEKIQKLLILDKEFDSFILQKFSHINYDIISRQTKAFETNLLFLQQSRLTEEFGSEFDPTLRQINALFLKKYELIEYFKSINSRTLNSLHYLFDLHHTIATNPKVPDELQRIVDNTLFGTVQLFTNIISSSEKLHRDLEIIRKYGEDQHLKNIIYFDRPTRMLIESFKEIQTPIETVKNLQLYHALVQFEKLLRDQYDAYLFQQKMITLLFFLASFIILIVLILTYIRSKKTTLELSAFKFAVEHSDNSVVMTDLDRKIIYVNDVFEKDTGYSKDEVLGENPRILKSDIIEQSYYDEMNKVLDRGEKWEGEFINKRKDGSLFYEKASIVPVFVNKKLINYLAIKLDISDYVEQKKKLQQSATVFENTEEGILITDKEGLIISANKAFEVMTGYRENEIVGQTPAFLQSGKQDEIFYKTMWEHVVKEGVWKGKIFDRTRSGDLIPIWLSITAVKDEQGEVSNYISIHTNLQEIVKTQEKADFLAYHDSLTLLPNRINFEEYLDHALKLATRNSTKFALLFIDLDRFKVINDTLGHHIGDELLKRVSGRIRAVLRDADMLARLGGDEFVVVLESLEHEHDAAYVSEKILAAVKEPIEVDAYTLNTSASIGIAIYPNDGMDRNTIVKHADSAMYHAKELGKNRYQYYTVKLSVDVEYRLEMEQALRHAIENNELFVVYQPQYDLKSKKIIGAEALLRWNNSTLGQVSPADFIPVAEDIGMIFSIGDFVFEEACRTFMQWQSAGLELELISVNLSTVQFRQKNLVDRFKKIIDKTGIDPQCIEIEITESYFMEFTSSNQNALRDLRNLGLKIAIDDFGTGYSSMSYLKQIPIDTIKVDKSFVDGIPDDENDVKIAQAIMALAKSLGYSVVAEGIETEKQEEALREYGCDYGQGFLFSPPVSADELMTFSIQGQMT